MLTLTCRGCGQNRAYPPAATIQGLPALAWWTARGQVCLNCTTTSGPASRTTDPSTSHKGAADVAVRAGSQRHELLAAYGGGKEMTADEAMRDAGVNERSCYWKRVSELVAGGYLEDCGTERMAEQGSKQRVNRITTKGSAVFA
jgi:hypothetical protein